MWVCASSAMARRAPFVRSWEPAAQVAAVSSSACSSSTNSRTITAVAPPSLYRFCMAAGETTASATQAERRPAVVAVDDDPVVLAAVARDLRRGFGDRYRILRAASGAEALELLAQLR